MTADHLSPKPTTATSTLVPTSARHLEVCGERIPCPVHGLVQGIYRPAERHVGRLATLILSNCCGRAWREVAA
jgi:hypothetical protein